MPPRPDTDWTPLDAAAKALGISPDATRKRIERGTLPGEKQGGRWFVATEALAAGPHKHDTPASGQQDAIRTPPDVGPDSLRELVDHLKEENEFLRSQLDKRSQELADERERSDVLHREAFARIEALTTGPSSMLDDDQVPEPNEDPDEAPADAAKTPPESPQRHTTGSGATNADALTDESNNGPSNAPRSVFGDWWAWVRGR